MITLELRGDDEVRRRLQSLSRRVKNRESLHKRYAVTGKRWVARNFEDGGRPRWAPLKPSTARKKVTKTRRRGTSNILRVTGALRGSFTGEATRQRAVVGTNKAYAKYHQKGTKHLPVRAMLPTKKQADEFTRPITEDWVEEQIRKSGLK